MCKFVLIVRSYLDNNYVHRVHIVLNKTTDSQFCYNVIVMFW